MNLDKKSPKISKVNQVEDNVFSENKVENNEWTLLVNHVFDEDSYYRIVSSDGYQDFLKNNILRSSPEGTPSKMAGRFDIGHRPTSFPSFDKGTPDLSYAVEGQDNYIFESKIPMYRRGDKNPLHERPIKGRHWAYRPIDLATGLVITNMTPDMIQNIFKLDKQGNLYLKK